MFTGMFNACGCGAGEMTAEPSKARGRENAAQLRRAAGASAARAASPKTGTQRGWGGRNLAPGWGGRDGEVQGMEGMGKMRGWRGMEGVQGMEKFRG